MPTGVLPGVNTTVISVKSSLQSYIKERGIEDGLQVWLRWYYPTVAL